MTQEEKEKIDYEIKAKIDARNKDLGEWVYSGFIAVAFILILFAILGVIS